MKPFIGLALQHYLKDESEGTDFYAVKNGYVSITPIQADLTAYHSLLSLQNWLDQEFTK